MFPQRFTTNSDAIIRATPDLGGYLIQINNPINEGGAVMNRLDLIQAARYLLKLAEEVNA